MPKVETHHKLKDYLQYYTIDKRNLCTQQQNKSS
jgi:hypothetical protein